MVARLKLKGIDGRAPPGVNLCSQEHLIDASTMSINFVTIVKGRLLAGSSRV